MTKTTMKKPGPKITSIAQALATVDKDNARFMAASAATRRVMIAKEAMARIEARDWRSRSGIFCSFPLRQSKHAPVMVSIEEGALRPQLGSGGLGVGCRVCAMGALFLSAVMLRNRYNLTPDNHEGNTLSFGPAIRALTEFSLPQKQLIESAFELGLGAYRFTPMPGTARARAIEFGAKYRNDAARLEAILENIIANKGTFKP